LTAPGAAGLIRAPRIPNRGRVAQLVEQRIENPRVVGSIPTPATIFNDNPRMNPEWLGYAAAALTSASFIPQAVMAIRSRDTRGISRGMYIIFVIGVALWLAYGTYLDSLPMILANVVTLGLAGTVLALKLRYG
jgi:MtN3 and saliva related transmembrane protein